MKRKMCSYLSVLLCFLLCLSAAGAAGSRDLSYQEGQAMRLERLGLFLGVGEDQNGFTNFDLNRTPSREEAVTMLVRALGKGSEAVGMAKSHPFTDVPVWADGYVSYAYSQGLTKGISDTAFGAGETVTGAMYVTFMLRALGYVDGEDFTWDNPWDLAEDCGILSEEVDRENFLRADAVDVTTTALSAKLKGTDTTLAQNLIAEGAFSQEAFTSAFQTYEEAMAEISNNDFYHEEQRWESNFGTVLLGRVSGVLQGSGYTLQLVTKSAAAVGEGLIISLPLDNKTAPAQPALSADGRTFTYTAGSLGILTIDLNTAMSVAASLPAEQPADSVTEDDKDAYDRAVDALINGNGTMNVTVEARLESDICTVLSLRTDGWAHGSAYNLALIYKPGSVKGSGESVTLPLPQSNGIGMKAHPENLTLNAEANTLTYTCTIPEPVVVNPGQPEENVVSEAGIYTYTVDLNTGVATLTISPLDK